MVKEILSLLNFFMTFSIACSTRSDKKSMWFIGVEVEQETSAPTPKKNPGSAPVKDILSLLNFFL